MTAVKVLAKRIVYGEIEKEFSKIPLSFLRVTEKFINGDHWQNQAGWIGWTPETNSPTASTDWNRLYKNFTPKNVILGIVKRLEGAIMGKEPDWQIVSTDETKDVDEDEAPVLTDKQKEFKEIDALMVDWWTNKNVHQKFKDYLCNKKAYGKACMRIYIPSGYINESGNLDTTDLAEILDKIYIDVPNFDSFVDMKDSSFGKNFVVVSFKSDESDKVNYEINYVDVNKKTVIRQVSGQKGEAINYQSTNNPPVNEAQARKEASNNIQFPFGETEPDKNASGEIEVDLSGNNLCYVSGEYKTALISDPVHRQQRQINHAKTMEGYALLNINFPETIFFNANMTEEVTDPTTGAKSYRPLQLKRGAGFWSDIKGIILQAFDRETITQPSVHYREPADPQKFAQVAENNTRDMHQEVGMLYIHLGDSPYPSGDARVEAMTDYIILLVDSKTDMDTLGVWCLTTALRLAFSFAGKTEMNKEFKVVFASNITIGKVSNDDKTTMQAEVTAGLRTKRSYMIVAETSDNPDADLVVIKADTAEDKALEIKNAGELAKATAIEKPKTSGASA